MKNRTKINLIIGGTIPLLLVCLVCLVIIFREAYDANEGQEIVVGLLSGIISGIISGFFIFIITTVLSGLIRKVRFEADINEAIDNLGVLLLRSLFEVNNCNLTLTDDRALWRKTMIAVDWNQKCGLPHLGLSKIMAFHIEFDKFQKEIVLIETMYKELLSDEINSLLMSLYHSDVIDLVSDLSMIDGNDLQIQFDTEDGGMKGVIIDGIIDLMNSFEELSIRVSNYKRNGLIKDGKKMTWPR